MTIASRSLALAGSAALLVGVLGAGIAIGVGATAKPAGLLGQRIRQFARWKQLVHATVTVDRPGSGIQTFELDHGTITALPAGSITISEAGGASITVATDASTRVRKDRAKAALSDLSSGDQVVVVSMVSNGSSARALLIVVPPVAPTSPTQ